MRQVVHSANSADSARAPGAESDFSRIDFFSFHPFSLISLSFVRRTHCRLFHQRRGLCTAVIWIRAESQLSRRCSGIQEKSGVFTIKLLNVSVSLYYNSENHHVLLRWIRNCRKWMSRCEVAHTDDRTRRRNETTYVGVGTLCPNDSAVYPMGVFRGGGPPQSKQFLLF